MKQKTYRQGASALTLAIIIAAVGAIAPTSRTVTSPTVQVNDAVITTSSAATPFTENLGVRSDGRSFGLVLSGDIDHWNRVNTTLASNVIQRTDQPVLADLLGTIDSPTKTTGFVDIPATSVTSRMTTQIAGSDSTDTHYGATNAPPGAVSIG
jgi:hypothetical protein